MQVAVSSSAPVNNHVIGTGFEQESHPSNCNTRNTYTHLTYSRHHLVETAMETIKIAENGEYTNSKGKVVNVKQDLINSVDRCTHYEHEFDFYEALEEEKKKKGSGRRLRRGSSSGSGGLDSFDEENNSEGGNSSSLSPTSTLSLLGNNPPLMNALNKFPGTKFPRTSFLVVSASWLESALELLGSQGGGMNNNVRVGVLNSASGTTPGGRFLKGTVSQEDCLCRASLLYSCISQPKFQSEGRFYGKNRSLKYGTSNCVIFSPDVPVIREDNVEGKLLDKPAKVSFVTIPAPNAFTTSSSTGKEYNDIESEERQRGLDGATSRNNSVVNLAGLGEDSDFDEAFEKKRRALLDSLSDRIHRALSAFVLGNCTDLVLPAFGCGVHGNDPSMVASVFREMLTDQKQFGGRFRTVVFAIPPSRKQNYQAFAAYFQQKETVQRVALTRGVSAKV